MEYRINQRGDPLGAEGRLEQAALAAPFVPLDGDQAVADHGAGEAVMAAAGIVAGVIVEDAADVVGVGEEVVGDRPEVVAEDVAEAALGGDQEAERIAAVIGEGAVGEWEELAKAGGTRGGHLSYRRRRWGGESAGCQPGSSSLTGMFVGGWPGMFNGMASDAVNRVVLR